MIPQKDKEILENLGFKKSSYGAGASLKGEVYEYNPCIIVRIDVETDYVNGKYL